jgi:hypothetical protein
VTLRNSKLVVNGGMLELRRARIAERLQSDSVARRLQRLGDAMEFATTRVISGKAQASVPDAS